jgi:hypothetical protein
MEISEKIRKEQAQKTKAPCGDIHNKTTTELSLDLSMSAVTVWSQYNMIVGLVGDSTMIVGLVGDLTMIVGLVGDLTMIVGLVGDSQRTSSENKG